MSYQSNCPSCGAGILFRLASSLALVCEHCHGAVARQGVDLESYGRIADLIPTPSILRLGIAGRAGHQAFTLIGRLQLDHGSGTWDEWYLGLGDQGEAWLSEAQGALHLMLPVAMESVPRFEELEAGQIVSLGRAGEFVVTEVRRATLRSALGELPRAVASGTVLHYADLSSESGRLGTIDYGNGSEAESIYIGRQVTLDHLGIRDADLVPEEERHGHASARSLSCTQCGGPLELRAPDETQRIGCPWCGALLDATGDYRVLDVIEKQVPIPPEIPLGSEGILGKVKWTVIGFLVRSVTYDGVQYPWREYLLYEKKTGFRWLTESDGHWSFVVPVPAGQVKMALGDRGRQVPALSPKPFAPYQRARATVEQVLGECYWAVERGEQVLASDFVNPPYVLSAEETFASETPDGPEKATELVWSLGTYTDPAAIWTAFHLDGQPRRPMGVAPNQVWPHDELRRGVWRSALLLLVALLILYAGSLTRSRPPILTQGFELTSDAAPDAPEAALFSEPFQVHGGGNLAVRVEASVDNSWLYLDGALVNEDTGEVRPFELEVSYYHGPGWTEGADDNTRYLGSVGPGRYFLRLAPSWDPSLPLPDFDLIVRRRVPRLYQSLLALFAIILVPLVLSVRRQRFEQARWSESDYG